MSSSSKADDSFECRHVDHGVITLLVGPNELPLEIDGNKLCEVSVSFKQEISKRLREKAESVIKLSEHEKETVELFIEWVQGREDYGYKGLGSSYGIVLLHLWEAVRLYVLAEKLQTEELREILAKEIEKIFGEFDDAKVLFTRKLIEYIYNKTKTDSVLRKLLAVFWVWHMTPGRIGRKNHITILDTCSELKQDVLIAMTMALDKCWEWITKRQGNPRRIRDFGLLELC